MDQERPDATPETPVVAVVESKPEVYMVEEVASLLRVSKNLVYDLIDGFEMPHVRWGPRNIRIPRRPFEKWLDQEAERNMHGVKPSPNRQLRALRQ